MGLKWPDLQDGRLHVQRGLVPGAKGSWRLEELKTDRSRRVVVLPVSTARLFKCTGLDKQRRNSGQGQLTRTAGSCSLDPSASRLICDL
jgi:hypothetical protein